MKRPALLLFCAIDACAPPRPNSVLTAAQLDSVLRTVADSGTAFAVAPDSVASVSVIRGIGGWGNGSNYSYIFRRDGLAHYSGGLRAKPQGDYDANVSQATIGFLLGLVADPRALRASGAFCSDAQTATIQIVLIDSTRYRLAAGCDAPRKNVRVARLLDSIGHSLSWRQVHR